MRLECLLDLAKDWQGVKVIIFGLPDLDNKNLNAVINSVCSEDQVVMCPFFPPRDSDKTLWKHVMNLNTTVKERNAKNGFGSPNLVGHMFYTVSAVPNIKEQFYTSDGLLWTTDGRKRGEWAIKEWHRVYKFMQEKKQIDAIRVLVVDKRNEMEESCRILRDDADYRITRMRESVERECEEIEDEMEERCRALRDECEIDCTKLLDTAQAMTEQKEKREREEAARRGRHPHPYGRSRGGHTGTGSGRYFKGKKHESPREQKQGNDVKMSDVLDEHKEVQKSVDVASESKY